MNTQTCLCPVKKFMLNSTPSERTTVLSAPEFISLSVSSVIRLWREKPMQPVVPNMGMFVMETRRNVCDIRNRKGNTYSQSEWDNSIV